MMKRCSCDSPCALMSDRHRVTIERKFSISSLLLRSRVIRFSANSFSQVIGRSDHKKLGFSQNAPQKMISRRESFGKFGWTVELRVHLAAKLLPGITERRRNLRQRHIANDYQVNVAGRLLMTLRNRSIHK